MLDVLRVLTTLENLEIPANLLILENPEQTQGILNLLREDDVITNGDCVTV